MNKEYRIECFSHDEDEEGEFIGWTPANGYIFTDWVEVAVAYTHLKITRPEEKFQIVSRDVSDWDTCYR